MPTDVRAYPSKKFCHALQHVRERKIGDRIDRSAPRLRRRDEKAERELGIAASRVQNRFAWDRHHRCVGERFGARRRAAGIEGAALVERVVSEPLADRVRLAIGRKQRIDHFSDLDDPEIRPDLALVKDRFTGAIRALAHL